ncbi:unnamed protein product [Mytilus coruscus]|uniref:Uncharacterized protein n=1 Tax=Mytilus coruscus TaxID=42192 RepID=A0A6J8CZ86_MYTCO|nr:unnamed protein product [Mytilus coruscus]
MKHYLMTKPNRGPRPILSSRLTIRKSLAVRDIIYDQNVDTVAMITLGNEKLFPVDIEDSETVTIRGLGEQFQMHLTTVAMTLKQKKKVETEHTESTPENTEVTTQPNLYTYNEIDTMDDSLLGETQDKSCTFDHKKDTENLQVDHDRHQNKKKTDINSLESAKEKSSTYYNEETEDVKVEQNMQGTQHHITIKCEDPLQRRDNISETKLVNNGTCSDVYYFHNYAQIKPRKVDPYNNSDKNQEKQNDGVDEIEEGKTHRNDMSRETQQSISPEHMKDTPLMTSLLFYNTWDDISVAEEIEVSTTLQEPQSIDNDKYAATNNSKQTVDKTSVKLKEQTELNCSDIFIVRAEKRRSRNSLNVKPESASIKKKKKNTIDNAGKIKPRRQLFASTSIDGNIDFQSHTENKNDSKTQWKTILPLRANRAWYKQQGEIFISNRARSTLRSNSIIMDGNNKIGMQRSKKERNLVISNLELEKKLSQALPGSQSHSHLAAVKKVCEKLIYGSPILLTKTASEIYTTAKNKALNTNRQISQKKACETYEILSKYLSIMQLYFNGKAYLTEDRGLNDQQKRCILRRVKELKKKELLRHHMTGRGRQLKSEQNPNLVPVLEYEFGEGDTEQRGGGGMEAHSRLTNTIKYKSATNRTRMSDARETVLAAGPPDFNISLSTCYNYTQNYRKGTYQAKQHHEGKDVNAMISLHTDISAENTDDTCIDSKDAKAAVRCNNSLGGKTWVVCEAPDHDWNQSRTNAITPMGHLFLETKIVKTLPDNLSLELKINFVEIVHASVNLHIQRLGIIKSSSIFKEPEAGSQEHIKNMEAVAEELQHVIQNASFGGHKIQCFRGVGADQTFLFGDENTLRKFLSLSEKRKMESNLG